MEREPDNLWRLYPLDPEEGRKGQMPRTQIDAPVRAPTSRANDGESGGQGDVVREDEVSSSPSLLFIAIALACAAALLVILAVRRAMRPAPSGQATKGSIRTVPEARPASETALTQDAADLSAAIPSGLSLVRVHLMSPSGPAMSRPQPSSAEENSVDETAEKKGA